MSTTQEPKLNIGQIEHKLPTPFLKDVHYEDDNGNMKTIKGFLGSVKNVKAINENDNYLQPFKTQDDESYLNPQISLSTFFVDKNNVIYGDFFHGTKHSKFTQLFPISQSEIQPLFHKKKDIQFDIAFKPILEKSEKNNEIATKATNMVGENYNIITQDNSNTNNRHKHKIKSVSPNENVLETVYKKYLKFNKKAFVVYCNMERKPSIFAFFNKEHIDISDLQKQELICFDDMLLFNVKHDELLAVPKDKDYKTRFDCAIITKLPSDIEDVQQILTTQAKCGYPYVIIYQDDNKANQDKQQPYKPPKLQYKLMSNYISDLKDTYAKKIDQARDELKKLDKKDFLYKANKCGFEKDIATYQQLIKDIEQDPDIPQFLKYEKQQIDYIISTKSKSFNCSNQLLKQCMQKIAKTDNVAEQLNYLINNEDEIKKEVLESEKRRRINQYYQGQLNIVNRRQQHCDSIKAAKKKYADKAIEACHNKKQVKNTKTIKQSNMRKI